jgi:Domain of unknown function (DUF4307)
MPQRRPLSSSHRQAAHTEATLSTSTTLSSRYGPRRAPRWLPAALLAVVVLAAFGVALLAYRNFGNPPIEGHQTAFTVLDDGSVKITFQVLRDQPERPADCIVRARSADGDETGRKEVYVPAGAPSVLLTTVLRTSQRPVTGEVFGCSYEVPPYLAPTT